MKTDFDIIIIGGGVAGMQTAVRLCSEGLASFVAGSLPADKSTYQTCPDGDGAGNV